MTVPLQNDKKPTVVVVVGMAGSGKSTFVQRLHLELTAQGKSLYTINLDPAVNPPRPDQKEKGEGGEKEPPVLPPLNYPVNIDIRDTVNYRDVMKEFKLGPNGAIMTALNLFSTRFDKVLDVLERRAAEHTLDYVIVDTPGQIEVFNWSASGQIILDSLANSFPTITAYVVDTERCESPVTFMSNMTYACSIMYKTKLPFSLVFNKVDVRSSNEAVQWMTDFESFSKSLENHHRDSQTYMACLSKTMALAMEEFYTCIRWVGVSSTTGRGFDELLKNTLPSARTEFEKEYLPFLDSQKKAVAHRKHVAHLTNPQAAKDEFENPKARNKSPQVNDMTKTRNDQNSSAAVDSDDDEDDDEKEFLKLQALLKAKK